MVCAWQLLAVGSPIVLLAGKYCGSVCGRIADCGISWDHCAVRFVCVVVCIYVIGISLLVACSWGLCVAASWQGRGIWRCASLGARCVVALHSYKVGAEGKKNWQQSKWKLWPCGKKNCVNRAQPTAKQRPLLARQHWLVCKNFSESFTPEQKETIVVCEAQLCQISAEAQERVRRTCALAFARARTFCSVCSWNCAAAKADLEGCGDEQSST